MIEKQRRHQFLRELVSQMELDTQEALVAALRRAGFQVTQATVSRDIRELNLVKLPTASGGHRYAMGQGGSISAEVRLDRLLAESYVSTARAANLIVLKVMPGNAHAVGAVLDTMDLHHLLGTIAGDDTLLLVCQDEAAAKTMEARLRPSPVLPSGEEP